MANFSLSRAPPISTMIEALTAMKLHYPYRLTKAYIIHASSVFHFVWSLVKPVLSKQTREKTEILRDSEIESVLGDFIGVDYLESEYGGRHREPEMNPAEYFYCGYWESVLRNSSKPSPAASPSRPCSPIYKPLQRVK